NRSIENVLLDPQHSNPNSGTLIHLILKSLIPANPNACTGNVFRNPFARDPGFRSAHAAAIFGLNDRNAGTLAMLAVSPPPNVILPFEFSQNPFHTPLPVPHAAPTWNTSPSGLANKNWNPPDSGPTSGAGLPPPSSSSPVNGNTPSSPPATWWHGSNNSKMIGPFVVSSPCVPPFGNCGVVPPVNIPVSAWLNRSTVLVRFVYNRNPRFNPAIPVGVLPVTMSIG